MKKTNNKGFSLIELIIVIAIMAILIGVLAPQYMKYVEKSRVSADKDTLDSVYSAATIAAGDPDVADAPTSTSGWLAVAVSSTGTNSAWGSTVLDTLKANALSDVSSKLKSKSCKANSSITVEVDVSGNFRVSCGGITIPEN